MMWDPAGLLTTAYVEALLGAARALVRGVALGPHTARQRVPRYTQMVLAVRSAPERLRAFRAGLPERRPPLGVQAAEPIAAAVVAEPLRWRVVSQMSGVALRAGGGAPQSLRAGPLDEARDTSCPIRR